MTVYNFLADSYHIATANTRVTLFVLLSCMVMLSAFCALTDPGRKKFSEISWLSYGSLTLLIFCIGYAIHRSDGYSFLFWHSFAISGVTFFTTTVLCIEWDDEVKAERIRYAIKNVPFEIVNLMKTKKKTFLEEHNLRRIDLENGRFYYSVDILALAS